MRPQEPTLSAVVILSAVLAAPLGAHAASMVPNFDVAGIPAPGFPHFDAFRDLNLTLSRTGSGSATTYAMAVRSTPDSTPLVFQADPWTAFNISGGSYRLDASFDSAARLTGGTVIIEGSIPGFSPQGTGGSPTGLLYKADLIAYGADRTDNATPQTFAFTTGNTDPASWAYKFQGEGQESIYLYTLNVGALMTGFVSPKFKVLSYSGVSALTTVPLPGAVWLFGSALAALAGARRTPTPTR